MERLQIENTPTQFSRSLRSKIFKFHRECRQNAATAKKKTSKWAIFRVCSNTCETYFLLLFDKIPCRLCIFCSCTSRDLSLTFCNRSIIASKNGMYFCISANFLSYSSISLVVYRSPVPGEENLYTQKHFSVITLFSFSGLFFFTHLIFLLSSFDWKLFMPYGNTGIR